MPIEDEYFLTAILASKETENKNLEIEIDIGFNSHCAIIDHINSLLYSSRYVKYFEVAEVIFNHAHSK